MAKVDLRALARERGVLTMTEAASAIAGEPIRGSWWAHPAGHAIFNALGALDDERTLLACKLGGKQAWVHRRLWPALARAQRERSLWPAPSATARRLCARVKRAGRLLASGKQRLELERAMLVVGREVHTESGAHRTELVPFEAWLPAAAARAAGRMSLDEALAQLGAAGVRLTAARKKSIQARRGS